MKPYVWIAALLSLAVCGCQENQNSPTNSGPTFNLSSFAGLYQDTLPVPGAIGNIVQLTIHADSTYSMVERTMFLEQKIIVPIHTAGKIELSEGGGKWKMIPRNTGAKTWWLSADQGQLMVLDSAGLVHTNKEKFLLERISTAILSIGNDRLFAVDKGSVRFPLNVYGRPGGGHISVAKFFLQSCPESDLALAFHYVNAFEGKLEKTNPIAVVLGKDKQTLNALSNRLIWSADGAALQRPVQQTTLTSVVFDRQPDHMIVLYSFLDAQDQNWLGKDKYALSDKGYTLSELGSPSLMK